MNSVLNANVLPNYVTDETWSLDCPGFTVLSTQLRPSSEISLPLFQLSARQGYFYHHDSISREKPWGNRVSTHDLEFLMWMLKGGA